MSAIVASIHEDLIEEIGPTGSLCVNGAEVNIIPGWVVGQFEKLLELPQGLKPL
jgi:hypothetical protein